MQNAYLLCAFSGGRARSSVLGVRPSASIRSRVPGTRDLESGTPYQHLSSKNPHIGIEGPLYRSPLFLSFQVQSAEETFFPDPMKHPSKEGGSASQIEAVHPDGHR